MDGRKIKKHINGLEIFILIRAIAKEKIAFKRSKDEEELLWEPQTLDHFNRYANFSALRLDKSKAPLPEELLSSLFVDWKNLKSVTELKREETDRFSGKHKDYIGPMRVLTKEMEQAFLNAIPQ